MSGPESPRDRRDDEERRDQKRRDEERRERELEREDRAGGYDSLPGDDDIPPE